MNEKSNLMLEDGSLIDDQDQDIFDDLTANTLIISPDGVCARS